MITYKVRGLKELKIKLKKISAGLPIETGRGMEKAGDYVVKKATDKLRSMARGPCGVGSIPITDPNSWVVTNRQVGGLTVTCRNPWAIRVEKGSIGGIKVNAYDYGHKGWPIGQRTGAILAVRKTFTVREGYHFLESTMNDPSVRKGVTEIVSRHLSKLLR